MNVYVYCEGQTEESFINEVLEPYIFARCELELKPIICVTKQTPRQRFRGGLFKYDKAKREIERLCKEHHNEYVTTMLDFYAFPDDAPGMNCINKISDIYERVEYVESEIQKDINSKNFIPNLMLHEFESLVFVNPELLSNYYPNLESIQKLVDIRDSFQSPEHIDSGKETAPSKRIIEEIPRYSKIVIGTAITKDIGVDGLRKECGHFSKWIDKLCSLPI